MSLCGTCSHVVKDDRGNPVSCHALIKYIPRDTCPFYELHPKYGSIKVEETINKLFNEEFIESVKKRENQESEEINDLDSLFNKDSEKIRTSMETAMITVIGETIDEHFENLEFIEVVRTSEEIFDKLSKFMEFKPMKKKRDEGIMEEWYGKCSICGVQIPRSGELHYDLEEYGNPAYCKKCWDMKEKERMQIQKLKE